MSGAREQESVQLGFERARLAAELGKWATALALLRSCVHMQTDRPEMLGLYGYCLARLGQQLEEARDACQRAVDAQPWVAEHHAHLGFVYHTAGLAQRARRSYDAALVLDPEHELARTGRDALAAREGTSRLRAWLRRTRRCAAQPPSA